MKTIKTECHYATGIEFKECKLSFFEGVENIENILKAIYKPKAYRDYLEVHYKNGSKKTYTIGSGNTWC